jgi:hypothetical protein
MKKRKRLTADEWAAIKERGDRTLRMLQERIDYYEERRQRREQVPAWRRRVFPWRIRLERL